MTHINNRLFFSILLLFALLPISSAFAADGDIVPSDKDGKVTVRCKLCDDMCMVAEWRKRIQVGPTPSAQRQKMLRNKEKARASAPSVGS